MKTHYNCLVFAVVSFLIFTGYTIYGVTSANSTNYYVKSDGNDDLDGLSNETAWATIAKVNATVQNGDTVYFRSQDTWTNTILPVLSAKTGVTYDGCTYGSGIRAKLKAAGGYPNIYWPKSVAAVVNIYASDVKFKGFEIDGGGKITGGIYVGMHARTNISNIAIDNCVVHDIGDNDMDKRNYLYGIHIGTTMGITVSNVSVTDTSVSNTSHEGIAIYPGWNLRGNKVDGVLIRNCKIHDTALFGGYDWGDAISVTNDADNVVIEFNTIYKAFRAIGIGTSKTYTGSPNNLIVRYNLLYENWFGIVVNHTASVALDADAVFYGNIILNNGKPWPHNYGADIVVANSATGNFGNSVFSFYNNTIYNVSSAARVKYSVLIAQWKALGGNPKINFVNNIVQTNNFTPVRDVNKHLTHSNNLIYRSSSPADEHVNNGTSFNKHELHKWESSTIQTKPNFVGGILPNGFTGRYGKDLRLNTDFFFIKSGHALKTGENLGPAYNGCINGAGLERPVTRPLDGPWDLGAYEYTDKPLK